MYSARNRNAMITDDSFQIQDWLRSNGNHDRSYPEFDYHQRIRPLSPVKRHRISTDGRGPDRRRQLKSMESLLGLSDENLNGKHLSSEVVTRASPDVQDSLDRALMDFEETLELAFQSNSIVPPPRGFSNHNLFEGDESNLNKLDSSFDSHTTTGSSGYSTKPDQSTHRSVNTYNELQFIREQMAKSLEIIKDLEEQVKMVPKLKAQVSSLNMEKQQLSFELDKHKQMENTNKSTGTDGGDWRSLTLPANRRALTTATAVTTKDVGISCVPMCRDVGVTTPSAADASTSCVLTMTEPPVADVQTNSGCAGRCGRPADTATASTQTATVPAVETTTTTGVKAVVPEFKPALIVTADVGTQSARPAAIRTSAIGVTAKPRTYDASVSAKPITKNVGCSADIPERRDTAAKLPPTAITPVARATQTEIVKTPTVHARGTQTAVRTPPLAAVGLTRATQTDVATTRGNDAVAPVRPVVTTIGRRSNSFHHYTVKDLSPPPVTVSKIPRLMPVTPEPNRKVLLRQDTYHVTKEADDDCRDPQLKHGQQRQQVTTSAVDDYDDNDDKPKESMTPKHRNGLPESDMNFKPIREDLYKDNPSKEMKGALKVLNDSLKKTSSTLLPRVQLKQAIDVVREEWFKIGSSSDCNGYLVKSYVNCFTSYSPVLLEFIINMTDSAGNTVLHYAISHGNFDVVSTIMDTGVSNVNLTNDAGYSCVMLVSLAEIKNDDEMKIIKRLFKCGNVNLQAKKHGQTTLMLAVSHGKIEVVKLLLECEADLNIQDEDGSTALMCAAEHGLQEIVNILLSCPECDVSIADNDGSTALGIAMEAGHREIGIALYAKQHNILSRENSPFTLSKSKRSRSANTILPSNQSPLLQKSPSLQSPREYATLSSMLKTRIPQ